VPRGEIPRLGGQSVRAHPALLRRRLPAVTESVEALRAEAAGAPTPGRARTAAAGRPPEAAEAHPREAAATSCAEDSGLRLVVTTGEFRLMRRSNQHELDCPS